MVVSHSHFAVFRVHPPPFETIVYGDIYLEGGQVVTASSTDFPNALAEQIVRNWNEAYGDHVADRAPTKAGVVH